MPSHLYMFAIMPPAELSVRIHQERMNFAEEYKAVKALKPPVHITLHPPFKIPAPDVVAFEQVIVKLQTWTNRKSPFFVELNNYSYFNNKHSPVLFIDVVRNDELTSLHSEFIKELKKYMDMEKQSGQFKPHITIGYRDIDPEIFTDIRAAYSRRKFNASFLCDTIYLWKHDGNNWQVLKSYQLSGVQDQLSLF